MLVRHHGGHLGVFAGYVLAYGTGRFLLEQLRTDTTFRLLGVSRNGWIAAVLVWASSTADLTRP